jgi:Ser/Thr protein kinase RdoA (MazF antagonist)
VSDLFDEAVYAVAAEQALRAFPIGPARLQFVHVSENVTYRAFEADSSRTFVLRLHRPTYHSLQALRSERIWTRALFAAGIPVPEPVSTATGEDYVSVRVAAVNEIRWAGLARWVEGELLSNVLKAETDQDIQSGYFSRLGSMLGAAHNHASGWRPPTGFVRHSLDADGLMGEQPFWGPFWDDRMLSPEERDLLIATRDKIRGAMLRYGKPSSTFSMIHADLHPDNVLVAGDRLVMIDFDDAGFGWHQYDIAVALLPYENHQDFARFSGALISGYRAVRDLSDEDLALLPMFMLSRQLAVIGWLHARPELGRSPRLATWRARACHAAAEFEPPC